MCGIYVFLHPPVSDTRCKTDAGQTIYSKVRDDKLFIFILAPSILIPYNGRGRRPFADRCDIVDEI